MGNSKLRTLAIGGVAALGLLASACGSSSSATATSGAGSGSATHASSGTSGSGYASGYGSSSGSGASSSSASTTVKLASASGVGKVLVDSSGYTLYLFEKDAHKTPTCTGACNKVWPPLLASKAVAGSGVKASLLGTVKDPNGKTQVTYHGWPLYTFSGDTKPGQAKGEGLAAFGSKWWAVSAAGTAAAPSSASSSSSSGSSSGGGWGG